MDWDKKQAVLPSWPSRWTLRAAHLCQPGTGSERAESFVARSSISSRSDKVKKKRRTTLALPGGWRRCAENVFARRIGVRLPTMAFQLLAWARDCDSTEEERWEAAPWPYLAFNFGACFFNKHNPSHVGHQSLCRISKWPRKRHGQCAQWTAERHMKQGPGISESGR